MADQQRSLLVVAVPATSFARIPPLLWRDAFDVNTVDNPRLALKAVAARSFSLVLTGYPLAEMEFQRFLDEVRAFGSPCRKTPVAALVSAAQRRAVGAYLGRGLNRVMVVTNSDQSLARALAEMLSVAPRLEVRRPLDLTARVSEHDRRLLTQTVNLSRTGMLVSDAGGLEVGAVVSFELDLGGAWGGVGGRAEVVRLERRSADRHGCGVRFTELEPAARASLDAFLDSDDVRRLAPC